MSGIVAAMADNLALGGTKLVYGGLVSVFAFVLGAMATTVCIRWARSRSFLYSEYALVSTECAAAGAQEFTPGKRPIMASSRWTTAHGLPR
jgi:uncharacterized membrane protein YoaK (UPF0700 family)